MAGEEDVEWTGSTVMIAKLHSGSGTVACIRPHSWGMGSVSMSVTAAIQIYKLTSLLLIKDKRIKDHINQFLWGAPHIICPSMKSLGE